MTGIAQTADATTLDIEDHAALLAYLRSAGHIAADEQPVIRTLTGGVSNRTVLVERAANSFVVKQALAKLRVAVEWHSDPDRIFREAAALRALAALVPAAVPAFMFEDRAARLFAMSAVSPRARNWKALLLAGDVDATLIEAFGTLLGDIHRLAAERDAALRLSTAFADRSLFESLRLEPYYAFAAANEPRAATFLADLADDTRRHAHTLVHGDYSPKNVLVDGDRLVLLDFEVAHWGDPAFDVGFGLTHLLSKAHHVVAHRDAFREAARTMWRSYQRRIDAASWGDVEARTVRHTAACLLARVCGRSPLEYLTDAERRTQREAAVALIRELPPTVDALVERFVEHL